MASVAIRSSASTLGMPRQATPICPSTTGSSFRAVVTPPPLPLDSSALCAKGCCEWNNAWSPGQQSAVAFLYRIPKYTAGTVWYEHVLHRRLCQGSCQMAKGNAPMPPVFTKMKTREDDNEPRTTMNAAQKAAIEDTHRSIAACPEIRDTVASGCMPHSDRAIRESPYSCRTEGDPGKIEQPRNLRASTFTPVAQRHHHKSSPHNVLVCFHTLYSG